MSRFKDMQDNVLANRFREGDRNQAKRWINVEYGYVWNENDLSFKHVSPFDTDGVLTVEAGVQDPTMPAAFAELESPLLDENGNEIVALEPDVFARLYRGVTDLGSPIHYTVIRRQIYLGPAPEADATYTLGYRRLLCHLNGAGAVVAGPMSDNDDQPMWHEEGHDEVLVAGARARGKRRAQDPTWQADDAERDALMDVLLSDYGIDTVVKATFPRDPL